MVLNIRRYPEPEVVLKYAEWALKHDEPMAAHVFTKRESALPLSPMEVLEFLSPFPLATLSYLEYMIHDQASKAS